MQAVHCFKTFLDSTFSITNFDSNNRNKNDQRLHHQNKTNKNKFPISIFIEEKIRSDKLSLTGRANRKII